MFRRLKLFPWLAHACRSWSMTMWLTWILICGLLGRSFEHAARLWVLWLPVFIVLDLIRRRLRPDSAAFTSWLGGAVEQVRHGHVGKVAAPKSRLADICWLLAYVFTGYLISFVLVSFVRIPAEWAAKFPLVQMIYGVLGQLYPPATKEVAHIIALGHPGDAADLQHYIIFCLIFSAYVVFLYTGPALYRFSNGQYVKYTLPMMIKKSWPLSKGPRVGGVRYLAMMTVGLVIFGMSGGEDSFVTAYWKVSIPPPSLVFLIGIWGLAFAIAFIGLFDEVSSVE